MQIVTEEIEAPDEFERMAPRAAALVKAAQLRQLQSKLERLYGEIGCSDLYWLNDVLDDWLGCTTGEDGTLAACFAVRFEEIDQRE